jgi:hypothetical protein
VIVYNYGPPKVDSEERVRSKRGNDREIQGIGEVASNDAENDPKFAETRPKFAEMGPMLHEFWFEWGSFLPQLTRPKAVAIMGAINHI